jgi:hypothetical protein
MKTHKFAIALVAVLAVAISAYASPIFGTWRGDLNGKPITVTVTYSNGHPDVAMSSENRILPVSDAHFPKSGPPMMLRFQGSNQDGKAKLVSTGGNDLSFELETADGRESVLRVIDQGKTIATVKMTKTDAGK